MSFITMHNINKTFYGTKALNNIEPSLNYGEALCLAGQNGCGKSTLIKILSGVYQPDQGAEIKIGNRLYSCLTPEQAIKQGIQVIYQDLSLFPNLTVAENIAIAYFRPFAWVNSKQIYQQAQNAINSINADLDLEARVENLSVAQQQLVAICRAISQNARLLIMDEPTASLTTKEVENLLNVVRYLKGKGISIIFVSHKLNEVMAVSDKVLVLRDGNMVGKYPIAEISEQKLAFLMTGLEINHQQLPLPDFSSQSTLLEVKQLTLKSQYQDISFDLKRGEILSIIGLLGSGRTELCLTLFGMSKPDEGEIVFAGQKIQFKHNRQAISAGIAYVSEDRINKGLIMAESIHHNIIATMLTRLAGKFLRLNNKKAQQISTYFIEQLNIKISDPHLPISTLSGGNAQRVSIAKWLSLNPKLIILDSPTIGVDIANKQGIFNIITALAKQGISVIFISDEIDEAYYYSHRILVMKKGKITQQFIPQQTTKKQISEVVYATAE